MRHQSVSWSSQRRWRGRQVVVFSLMLAPGALCVQGELANSVTKFITFIENSSGILCSRRLEVTFSLDVEFVKS